MTNANRRKFHQLSAATVGGSVLTGCGVGAYAGPMQFGLGYVFRSGDIPADCTVVSESGTLQVVRRNNWPDVSLKPAQTAGKVDLPPNTGVAITLRKRRSGSGTSTLVRSDLTLAALKRTSITAETGCGSFGTVTWSCTDWVRPFQTWVSGPIMSSWIYRKPVGTDARLDAWLEVRLFAGGIVEVLPWIENGYVRMVSPTNKSANNTCGTSVLNLNNLSTLPSTTPNSGVQNRCRFRPSLRGFDLMPRSSANSWFIRVA